MLSTANAQDMLFATDYPPDKIVRVYTGSFSAAASSSPFFAERTHYAIDHSYGETVFLQMSYSRDGGVTWQDQHVNVPDLSSPSTPVFQTVEVGCYSTSTQIVMVASSYLGSVASIQFRVAAFWKD